MEYQIIEGGSPAELVDAVTEAIGEGWEPVGGVAAKGNRTFLQAMIKPEGGE